MLTCDEHFIGEKYSMATIELMMPWELMKNTRIQSYCLEFPMIDTVALTLLTFFHQKIQKGNKINIFLRYVQDM